MNIDNVVAQLIVDEGKKPLKYLDSRGFWTVGIGHKIRKGEVFSRPLTDVEMTDLCKADVLATVVGMNNAFPWWSRMPEDLQDAFVNMNFNMGVSTLLTFDTFLDLLARAQYTAAADDLVHTKWNGQVGNRAKRIEAVFRSFPNARQSEQLDADAGTTAQDSV